MQQWFCGSGFFFADRAGLEMGCRVFRFHRPASDAAYGIDAVAASGDVCADSNTKRQRIAYNSKKARRDKETSAVRGNAGKQNTAANRNAFVATR